MTSNTQAHIHIAALHVTQKIISPSFYGHLLIFPLTVNTIWQNHFFMPSPLPLAPYSSSSLYTETQKGLSLGPESTILLLVVAINKVNVKYLSNWKSKWQKWRGGRKIQRAGKLDLVVLKALFSCVRIWWIKRYCHKLRGFPGDSVVKNPPANALEAGDACSVPETGRWPGADLLQYSCLENSRGAWWAAVHAVTKSQTNWATKQ